MSSFSYSSPGLSQQPDTEGTQATVADSGAPIPIQDRPDWILLGNSTAVGQLRSQIQRIAPYFRVALIRGETGAGKQLAARTIHALSPGGEGEFVAAPAVAFAESVAGGEAARPVALAAATALLESARGGTLYLQGVAELSFGQQAGLLRFLCSFEERRGGPAPGRADVRILAASDRDLRTLSAIGQFRQDLYSRLAAVEILVPALRQRRDDIPDLADWLLRRFAEQAGGSVKRLADETIEQLRQVTWPDNLRGLRSTITHAAVLAEGAILEPRHLLALAGAPLDHPAALQARLDRLDDVIERHVLEVLTRCGGNKLRTAELLGISRSTLYRMLDARQDRRIHSL